MVKIISGKILHSRRFIINLSNGAFFNKDRKLQRRKRLNSIGGFGNISSFDRKTNYCLKWSFNIELIKNICHSLEDEKEKLKRNYNCYM